MKLLNLNKKSTLVYILLVCIFLIPGVIALLHSGFFQSDDGTWMVVRFSAFYEALRFGQFPVRYLPRLNFEYGYPVADFLYPLFMYIAVPIHVLGLSFVNTIKVILGLSVVTSGIFCFLWLRKIFSSLAALIGAVAYGLFPYHMWDIYKRGSVGEVLALAIVPFILWQIERKSLLLCGLGVGLLILSHNTLALFFVPLVVGYGFFVKKLRIVELAMVLSIGLGLSAFFWIPALFDTQFTVFGKTQISDISSYFIQPSEYSLFGIITLVGFAYLLYYARKKRETVYWFFLYVGFLSIFLALPISQFVWDIVPIKSFIQFPFRFLSVTMLCVSFEIGLAIQTIKLKNKLLLSSIALVIIYISGFGFFTPKEFQNYPDSFYATNVDTTTVKNEYMPKWVTATASQIPTQKIIGNAVILSQVQSFGTNISFQAIASLAGNIFINQVYFPGWNAFVDGKQAQILYNNPEGLMQIGIPSGTHTFHVYFSETPVRAISDAISVLSILVVGLLLFYMQKKRYATH